MTLKWEGEDEDARAARRAAEERARLLEHTVGEPITLANEFAEVRVVRVETRNGSRLLVESPKSGQWIALDPVEIEALTWQTTATFSAMIGNPFGPLVPEATGGIVSAGEAAGDAVPGPAVAGEGDGPGRRLPEGGSQ